MPAKFTNEIIAAAIEGFEAQKTRIDQQIAELRAMLSGRLVETAAIPEIAPRKRKISAAARRRMALGQKRRWAAIKGTAEPSSPTPPESPKPKRRIGAEGMRKIVAATKRRWAKVRAEKAAKAPAAAKKAATKKVAGKKVAKKTAAKRTAKARAQVTQQAAAS